MRRCARENRHLAHWRQRFAEAPGVRVEILPDPTRNPLDRLRVHIEPEAAGAAAWDIAAALAAGDPPVIVRDQLIEHGFFYMDPCNLHDAEAEIVAERKVDVLAESQAGKITHRPLAEIRVVKAKSLIDWLP